jgi:hypothetical protein
LYKRRKAENYQVALLEKFQMFGGDEKWLSKSEKVLLKSPPMLGNAKQSQSMHFASACPVSDEYEKLKKLLSKKQLAPLEKLMKLVGLKDVKRVAMQFYTDALADESLKTSGYKESVAPRVLNFLFLGNPGTGKTITGELFGELLEQSGARAAYKFIKMTAAEALRKGAKQFAAQVASLTGGRKGVGPPPEHVLRKGMPVEVDHKSQKWPGKITAVDPEKNQYTVEYSDGTEEQDIPRKRIQAIGEKEVVGGVLFIDEAYDLEPQNNSEGRAIVNELMSVAEEFRDTVTIILAGYSETAWSQVAREGF